MRILPATIIALTLLVTACTQSPDPKKPAAGYLPDSQATAQTPPPPAANQPTEQPQTTPGQETFEQRNARLATTIFPDYKKITLDPMDAFPRFKTARKEEFIRLRRAKPIANHLGSEVYPRILVKSYRFATQDALKGEVETWLNAQEHSPGQITLGTPVKTFKSPPLFCMATDTDFWMVQWSCVYEGPEWDQDRTRFFETAKAEGALHTWEVQCNGGNFKYPD